MKLFLLRGIHRGITRIVIGLCVLATGCLCFYQAARAQDAARPTWTTSQLRALAKAKTEKKMVLMNFTGKGWSAYSMKMDKEVFSTPEFMAYAQDNLVLVELNFPSDGFNAQAGDESTQGQNATLKAEYEVKQIPSVVVLDANGRTLKMFVGYQAGGPKAFIAQLEKLKG